MAKPPRFPAYTDIIPLFQFGADILDAVSVPVNNYHILIGSKGIRHVGCSQHPAGYKVKNLLKSNGWVILRASERNILCLGAGIGNKQSRW
jgi:hypothetical protein